MASLRDILPEFAEQFEATLRAADKLDLADQVSGAQLERWEYTAADDAGFIHLNPSRELNVVETKIIGSRYSHSIELELPGMVIVDIDNFGRITGIELLNRADIFDQLAKRMPMPT